MSPDSQRIAMKTKLKPKPRKMWANYYPHCSIPSIFDNEVRAISWKKSYPATVMTIPVAVIPLDDPDAMIARASTVVSDMICTANISDICRAVLLSSGVLPKPRKGGRK